MKKSDLLRCFHATIPVMTGYLVLGFGYGVFALKSGQSISSVLLASVFIYAGSMQFVLVDLIRSQASIITTIVTTLMVNARHLFYGISMIDRYKDGGKKKPYLIFSLTDETYSLVCSKVPDRIQPITYYFYVSLFDHIYWITGSLLGALVGKWVNFNSTGIEFAMTALFVTVFVEQWLSTKNHLPALIGLGISILCLLLFGPNNFLIPAMVGIGILLLGMRQREVRGMSHE